MGLRSTAVRRNTGRQREKALSYEVSPLASQRAGPRRPSVEGWVSGEESIHHNDCFLALGSVMFPVRSSLAVGSVSKELELNPESVKYNSKCFGHIHAKFLEQSK